MPAGGNSISNIDWNEVPVVDAPALDAKKLSKEIGQVETGGDYTQTNQHSSATGKHQFLWNDFGDDIKRVTGVKSKSEYLNNPQAQEKFFRYHVENNLAPSVNRLRDFNKKGYSDEQLAKLVHFKGESGAEEYLTTGEDPTPEHNIPISKYVGEPANAIDWSAVPVSDDPSPQKKSPDVSESGLAASSQPGQNTSPQNNPPVSQPTQADNWNTPADVSGNIFGRDIQGAPIINSEAKEQPYDPVGETTRAATVIANHIIKNTGGYTYHPYEDNINKNPDILPGNIIHDATDLHGSAKVTGDQVQYQTQLLERQRQQEIAAITNDPANARAQKYQSEIGDVGSNSASYQSKIDEVNDKYNKEISELQNAGKIITGHQLANEAYQSNKNKAIIPNETGEEIPLVRDWSHPEATLSEEPAVEGAGQGITGTNKPINQPAINAGATQSKEQFQKKKKIADDAIAYDPLALGIKQAMLLGSKGAEQDMVRLNTGGKIPDERMVDYEFGGLNMLQAAAATAKASDRPEVAEELNAHSDDIEKRLEDAHPDFFRKMWGQKLGSYAYNNESNPLYGSIFSQEKFTPKQIREMGPKAGLTEDQIKKLKPDDVPTMSNWLEQGAQAAFNTFTFRNENDPGGKLFTGETPMEQHQLNNWRGITGEIASGAGTLAGFMAQGGIVGNALKSAGALGDLAANAKRYETASNIIPLAASNYSNAYHTAKEVIGDKPEDEWKRLLFAATEGTIGTALMSIDPATAIGKDAIKTAGKDYISMLKNNKLAELNPAEYFNKTKQLILNIAKTSGATLEHMGSQAFIMGTNQIANNLTKMAFDPEHRGGVMDGVGEAAIHAGVSMFLPSLFAGINAAKGSTPSDKALLWDVGNNSRRYREQVTDLYKAGKMTSDELQTAISGINKAASMVSYRTPLAAEVSGKKLTVPQRQEYAWNSLVEDNLQNKLEELNKDPNPDKSRIKAVQEKISELVSERSKILIEAGEMPKEEQRPLLKPTTELSLKEVSTQGLKSGTGFIPEKKEEKVAETEKNNIPLTPTDQIESQKQKPEENAKETSSNENGRQDGPDESSAKGSGQEANVREAASGQVSGSGQDRKLAQEGEPNKEKQAAEEQPLVVGEKKRRVFGKKNTEEIPIEKNDQYSAMDLGTESGKPANEVAKLIEEAKPDEKIGGGESFVDFKNRIKNAWEQSKKTAQDQTLLMTHSGVMRMIKASEVYGWDDNEALKKVYDNLSEPEVAEKHTYKTDNGEIHLMRHGESVDGKDNLARREDTPLTPEGERQAKEEIAGHLKEEGIVPPVIATDDLPRTTQTAEAVQQELAKPEDKGIVKGSWQEEVKAIQDDWVSKNLRWSAKKGAYVTRKGVHVVDKEFKGLIGYPEIKSDMDLRRWKYGEQGHEDTYDQAVDEIIGQHLGALAGQSPESIPVKERYTRAEAIDKLGELGMSKKEAFDKIAEERFLNEYFYKNPNFAKAIKDTTLTDIGAIKIVKILFPHIDENGKLDDKQLDDPYGEVSGLSAKEKQTFVDVIHETKERAKRDAQPQEKKPLNGAIATEPKSEIELLDKKISELEDKIKVQNAFINQSEANLQKAEKDKKIEAWNEHNKKYDIYDRKRQQLIKEKEALEKERQDKLYDQEQKGLAGKLADYVESTYKKNKENHKGIALSGIIGISHKIADHVADFLVARVVDGLRAMNTVEMAIRRGIRQAKERFGKDAEDLSENDIDAIKQHLDIHDKEQTHEPSLPVDYEDDVKGMKNDIAAGRMTYEQAVDEVMNGEYYNRAGEPLSEHVAENAKDKILSYLNWHNTGRAEHNADLAEPEAKNRVIKDFGLKNGDDFSKFISGETIELRTGDEPLNEQKVIAYHLDLFHQDAQKMVTQMKHHFGSDVLDYGPQMLRQIEQLPGGETAKRSIALLGLMDELRKDQDAYELKRSKLPDTKANSVEKAEINKRLAEIPRLLKAAEKPYQDTLREASKTLNTARIMAKLFSGKFAHELHADEAILNTKQKEAKKDFTNKEADTKIPDAVVAEGPIRKEAEADKEVADAQDQMAKAKKAEAQKGKSKNVVKKVVEAATKKKAKDKSELERMSKDAADKLAKKGMTPENMFEKLKDMIKKMPC